MAQITCQNLTLGYDGKAVVTQLNFSVNRGDYLCIIGENGSGKSTLMKALLNLNKPMSGDILMGDGLVKNTIGYLPQQTQVQRDFPASVREIVLSGCLNQMGFHPFYTKEERLRAKENMEKLQILNLEKRCYRELSGGQQQRVLLARALCATQKMLILDEPVAGLDPVATQEMYELVERLNQKEKITIVMVSHDLNAAISYASHILHVDQVPRFFGTKEQYVQSEIGTAYLKAMGGIQND